MSVKCQELVDDYLRWLRDKIKVSDIGDVCEITTPFLDRHNDHIQIFVVPTNQGMRITDDSYILSDLRSSGCQVDTPSRKRILHMILNGFGVHEKDGELYVDASPLNFPQKKHAIVQAMLAVNDMFMTATQRVATLFLEDVAHFLDEHEVRNAANVEFTGKTGFIHKFDFLIPKSRKKPERLLRAINNPTKRSAASLLFSWTDTKGVRAPNSQFFVVLNDSEKEVHTDLLSAFQEYEVNVIKWSQREKHIEELAA